jgi:hypothetical protein
MSSTVSLITLQFLDWVAARPRSYAEVREAWHSTCPRTCAWEDAFNDELVRFEARDGRGDRALVVLTPSGAAALAAHGLPNRAPTPI